MSDRLGRRISTQGLLPPVQGYEANTFGLTSLMLLRRVEGVQSILRLLLWPSSDEIKHLCKFAQLTCIFGIHVLSFFKKDFFEG